VLMMLDLGIIMVWNYDSCCLLDAMLARIHRLGIISLLPVLNHTNASFCTSFRLLLSFLVLDVCIIQIFVSFVLCLLLHSSCVLPKNYPIFLPSFACHTNQILDFRHGAVFSGETRENFLFLGLSPSSN